MALKLQFANYATKSCKLNLITIDNIRYSAVSLVQGMIIVSISVLFCWRIIGRSVRTDYLVYHMKNHFQTSAFTNR